MTDNGEPLTVFSIVEYVGLVDTLVHSGPDIDFDEVLDEIVPDDRREQVRRAYLDWQIGRL